MKTHLKLFLITLILGLVSNIFILAEESQEETINSLSLEAVETLINYDNNYDELTELLIIDKANILSERHKALLYHFNELIHLNMTEGSPEIYIYTETSLPSYRDIDSYSREIFNGYGFGDAKKNNAVLLTIFPLSREFRITYGDGVYDYMKDFTQEDFEYNAIRHLQNGSYGNALIQMTENIVKYIDEKDQVFRDDVKYGVHIKDTDGYMYRFNRLEDDNKYSYLVFATGELNTVNSKKLDEIYNLPVGKYTLIDKDGNETPYNREINYEQRDKRNKMIIFSSILGGGALIVLIIIRTRSLKIKEERIKYDKHLSIKDEYKRISDKDDGRHELYPVVYKNLNIIQEEFDLDDKTFQVIKDRIGYEMNYHSFKEFSYIDYSKIDLDHYKSHNALKGSNEHYFKDLLSTYDKELSQLLLSFTKIYTLRKNVINIINDLDLSDEAKDRLKSVYADDVVLKKSQEHPVRKFSSMDDQEIIETLLFEENDYQKFVDTYESLDEDEKKAVRYFRRRDQYRRDRWLHDHYLRYYRYGSQRDESFQSYLKKDRVQYIKETTTDSSSNSNHSYRRSSYSSSSRSSSSSSYSGGSRGGSSSGGGMSGKW